MQLATTTLAAFAGRIVTVVTRVAGIFVVILFFGLCVLFRILIFKKIIPFQRYGSEE